MQQAVYNPLNPFPFYRAMRETDPASFNPRNQMWNIFRYEDVQRVLSEFNTFSSNFSGQNSNPLSSSLISMDPPRHRQLRSLVTQAFTPRAITLMSERIAAIVDGLLNGVRAKGHMDVIDDLAYPLPVIVIAEMLGIPAEDRARFKEWSDIIVGSARATSSGGAEREMAAYFLTMIAQRHEQPADDLISNLLAAQIEGEHLTQTELLGFCILLLVAGNETTTNLIGNALLCFDENPEVMAQLRDDPPLIPSAIEEVLRYRSPVQHMYRRCIVDTTIGDKEVRAGQMLLAWIGSANRDENQFPDADRFDITRTNQRHVAFGHGIHFCLGAPLARLEAKIALTLMFERMDNIRRVDDVPLEALESRIVYGLKHLPVTFTAR